MSAKISSDLATQWEVIQAESPPSPSGVPTDAEIVALRAHKARVKAFLGTLPQDERAFFVSEEKKKKKKRKGDARNDEEPSGDDAATTTKKEKSAEATTAISPSSSLDIARSNVAEVLAARLGTKPQYLTDDGSSWFVLAKRWMATTNKDAFTFQWSLHPTAFQPLKLFGRTYYEQRWSQAWGFNYQYSGTVSQARELRDGDDESEMVRHLIDRANVLVKGVFPGGDAYPYNGCLQNWYEPEQQIGLHSDDEKSLRDGFPIFSLSWGGTRRFVFKARADSPSRCLGKVCELYLKDGDLLVMGGSCQKTHKHMVPKPRKTMDPITSNRINWTIRAFAAH